MDNTYDAKKYKCQPWYGARGPTWVQNFKPAFENVLRGEKDNFSDRLLHEPGHWEILGNGIWRNLQRGLFRELLDYALCECMCVPRVLGAPRN